MTNNSEVNLMPTEIKPVAVIDNKADDDTVQKAAYLLHIQHSKKLIERIETEMARLQDGQQKITFANDLMQSINNSMDANGNLNIKNNAELQSKLQFATESLGIKLPPAEKLSFNAHETKRLLQNIQFAVNDWTREDSMLMRKIQTLHTESEQSIMIAKDTLTKIKGPFDTMNRNMKGS